jgi:hypothetical protein
MIKRRNAMARRTARTFKKKVLLEKRWNRA